MFSYIYLLQFPLNKHIVAPAVNLLQQTIIETFFAPKAITGSSEPDCRRSIVLCPAFGTVGAIFTLYFINMPLVHSRIPIGRVLLCTLTYFWQDVPSAAAFRSGSPIFMFVFYWSAQHTLKEKSLNSYMPHWNTWNGSWLLWYFCLHIGYMMRKLTDIVHKFSCLQTQWAVCLTVRSRSLFPPTVPTHNSLAGDSKLLVGVSVSQRWVTTEVTAVLDLKSFLNFHPNGFYLPQYSVCILSLLLSSLKGVCPNKLLIDLLCAFFSTCGQRSYYGFLSFL